MKLGLDTRTLLHLLIPIIFTAFSCESGSNTPVVPADRVSGDPVAITGKLGTEFDPRVSASNLLVARSIASAVSGIASIPLIAGNANITETITTDVSSDGTFTVNLQPDSGESYLLLLINSYATFLGDKCAGVLALRSGASSDLVALPLDLAKRDLDFGTVSLSGDAAIASTSLESQQENFDLTFDQLFEAVIRGNLYKHIKICT